MVIVIDLPPKPKGRPRFTKNGFAYTPSETRDYEDAVKMLARIAVKRPLTRPIKMDITFYLPIPKSWSKTKIEAAKQGTVRPTSKPDLDNLCKAILDALNDGIGYIDDKQIVELSARKLYGEPKTVIEMEEL